MLKPTLMAALAAVAIGGAGAFWYAGQPALTPLTLAADAQEATASSSVSKVPDMILGKIDAPVTVIEYASYTCPHCANFHNDVWEKFKTGYVDAGKVKFVYREVYFDKYGLWAAAIARCGGPEKYFGISDMLFTEQRDWLQSGTDQGIADALRKIGLKAGLTADQIDACLKDSAQLQAMVTTYQTNATSDNIQGTPTFIVNGESHSGEMTYDDFAKIVDGKLGG